MTIFIFVTRFKLSVFNIAHVIYSHHKKFTPKLTQHLQGVLQHGGKFSLFRTFHNLASNTNLVVYTLLKLIEERTIAQGGVAPDIVYLQIDGGPENSNKLLLALCEYLVAQGLVRDRVVLTRLVAGHTHEDIDARFAKIWDSVKFKAVLTPQEYADILNTVFAGEFELYDVFAVPDYWKYFGAFMDAEIKDYAKKEDTQLQWVFIKVTASDRYKHGVQVLYRAYSDPNIKCDQSFEMTRFHQFGTHPYVWEIKKADNIEPERKTKFGLVIGYEPVKTEHCWYPLPTEESIDIFPEDLPVGNIYPQPFVQGSVKMLVSTIRAIIREYPGSVKYGAVGDSKLNTVQQWLEFQKNTKTPDSDSVQEYLLTNPLDVPFRKLFLSGEYAVSTTHVPPKAKNKREEGVGLIRCRATSSVAHRGKKDSEFRPPRVHIDTGEPLMRIAPPYDQFSKKDLQREITKRGGRTFPPAALKDTLVSCLDDMDIEKAQIEAHNLLPDKSLLAILDSEGLETSGNRLTWLKR